MGEDIVAPFLGDEFADRFLFILVKTSNKTSGEFQNLDVRGSDGEHRPLYLEVARHAADWGDSNRIGYVVGATFPLELEAVRQEYPDALILIPGVIAAVRRVVN